jgi:hypothetical protein
VFDFSITPASVFHKDQPVVALVVVISFAIGIRRPNADDAVAKV